MVRKSYRRSAARHKPVSRHKKGGYLRFAVVVFTIGILMAAGGYFYSQQLPCANSITCRQPLTEKVENGVVGTYQGRAVVAPEIDLQAPAKPSVLGTNVPGADKRVYVDLSAQRIYAYEGDKQIFQALTSTGRWGRTPTGNFNIWSKLRSTRMSGGSGADYYNLPNVPYTMYFYNDFGLHGAYWHNNFGYTMSHGCVNLRPIDAEVIFNWVDGPEGDKLGTPVSVCDQFIGPSTCIQKNPVT